MFLLTLPAIGFRRIRPSTRAEVRTEFSATFDSPSLNTPQDHRITLFGNFFNSDIIDEGGSDPVFGEAMGEGTIYIPCEEEAGPRQLIVRVMDYDWGKRDDLLGKCDARSLLVCGECQRIYPGWRQRNCFKT